MNRKIVVLNCPPQSGKDTIAEEFINRNGYTMMSFKFTLINIALVISKIPKEEWDERYAVDKNLPWDKLGGLSQRNYLIKIGEEWVKPVHGKTYFGECVRTDITRLSNHDKFILPDGGFIEEIKPLYEAFGPTSLLILQWGRKNCSFDNDSRDWITAFPEITRRVDRDNDTTIEDHYIAVKGVIDEYFK